MLLLSLFIWRGPLLDYILDKKVAQIKLKMEPRLSGPFKSLQVKVCSDIELLNLLCQGPSYAAF